MKIPAVTIAAAFASGIVLGRVPIVAAHAARQSFLVAVLVIVAGVLCLVVVLCRRDLLAVAAITSLLGWAGLGLLAACLTAQPLSPEHILSRIASDQLPLRTPLRWNGTLRDEVSRLPWGYGLDVNLASVEMAEGTLPVTVGYTPREGDPPLPDVHAGDQISMFAEGQHTADRWRRCVPRISRDRRNTSGQTQAKRRFPPIYGREAFSGSMLWP